MEASAAAGARGAKVTMKRILTRIHKITGLLIAVFMVISGITGSILAFDPEIDAFLNPEVFEIAESGTAAMGADKIARSIEASDAQIWVRRIPIRESPTKSIVVYVEPKQDPLTRDYYQVDYDEVFVNPLTAEVTGQRMWGQCCSLRNFVPFVHKVHNRLALPAWIGRPVWGMVGLLWAVMSLIGIYLTIPAIRPRLSAWRRVWSFRRSNPQQRKNLQIHRATGLWFSIVSLPVAISGIGLAMYSDLFRPVVNTFSPITETAWDVRADQSMEELFDPPVSFTAALRTAQSQARANGIKAKSTAIAYSPSRRMYSVEFGDRLDAGMGISFAYIDATDNAMIGLTVAGEGSAGDIMDAVIQPLHSGRSWGLPGRIIVLLLGVAVSLLATTGALMWLSRQRKRRELGYGK